MSTEIKTTEGNIVPTGESKPANNITFDGNIFASSQSFQLAQRMAMALSSSTIVPKEYQGEHGLGNCMIALEMSTRLNTSPLMVMQNLYVVNGRPAWSSQYIIAMINSSRKYRTELQYDMQGSGDNMSCCAFAYDYNDHKVVGPTISMSMAKKEGWIDKNGSKWKTMPEVMLRYRAASFFGRLNCPDMIMGIYTQDEVIELNDDAYSVRDISSIVEQVGAEIAANANAVIIDTTETELHTSEGVAAASVDVDPDTGEVLGMDETPEDTARQTTLGPAF